MRLHHETGLHYIVSFPKECPALGDTRELYRWFAARHSWLSCVNHEELEEMMPAVSSDPTKFVVMWGVHPPVPQDDRLATFTRVYTEAFDEDQTKLIERHRTWLNHALENRYDGLFAHTPWMAKAMDGHVLPTGWHPDVMGKPDFFAPRSHRFTQVGSLAGKRRWLAPLMQYALGHDCYDASGQWGRDVLDALNRSSGYLYLAHSNIHSFSTPRIWQAVATSAALIAEGKRDCWPMTEEMYVSIPVVEPNNVWEVIGILRDLTEAELMERSRSLHAALRHFTIDHIVHEYLVPTSAKIASRL